jgi:hypothetical protein
MPNDFLPTDPWKVGWIVDASNASRPATDFTLRPPQSIQTTRVRSINPFVAFKSEKGD